ncbi:unnamed protein product, partial [Mesorhabditis belari]|uniref:Dedicator of cytokinesis C/D N-terminal domain-containing protein n=1 Tax=Mesorhabditis belari TaxID=2138241 RepID=A0AAF3J4U4_9BILA
METLNRRWFYWMWLIQWMLKRVSEFPADDVEVRIVAREQPTLDPPVNVDLNLETVDPHVRDVATALSDSFSLVQRRYQQFGSGDAYVRMLIERPIVARNAPMHNFENESILSDRLTRSATSGDAQVESRLNLSQPDPVIPNITQRLTPGQMDASNEARRLTGRQQQNLVNLLPPQDENDVIEKGSSPPFPEERGSHKLIIKVVKLHIEPSFEPIFGSIALYDAKMKKKGL